MGYNKTEKQKAATKAFAEKGKKLRANRLKLAQAKKDAVDAPLTKRTIDENWEVVQATDVAPESTFAAKEWDVKDELERMESFQYAQRHNEIGGGNDY